MNIKKLTSSIIACTLIGVSAPAAEYAVPFSLTAHASEYTKVTENNIEYNVYSDHAEIMYYTDESVTEVVIPSEFNGVPVTVINAYTFQECAALLSVTVPASITEINSWAFDDCTGLTQINVAKQNPYYCSVGGILFNKDKDIIVKYPSGMEGTAYTIPAGVKTIGDSAFFHNMYLKNIIIPNGVEMIQEYAFGGALELEEIDIPNSVKSIGESAFQHNIKLAEAKLPDTLEVIEGYTFSCCELLRSIRIPSSVTAVMSAAFMECNSLKNVIIPENVSVIEDGAFWCCAEIDNITILDPECAIGVYHQEYPEVICNEYDSSNGGMQYYGTISGYSGSTAEEYAEAIGCGFIAIDHIGDVNLDGAVDALDASLVLMEYAASATGKPSVIDSEAKFNADVNSDGTADALDASEILGYYAYKATGGKGSILEFIYNFQR